VKNFQFVPLTEQWQVGRFPALDSLPGVVHAVTTRDSPAFDSRAGSEQTRWAVDRIAEAILLPKIAWCHQVHGDTVLPVTAGGLVGEADALVTGTHRLGLLGRSADCPLILVAAPRGTGAGGWAVGMAHASWRSTVAGIASRLISTLVRNHHVAPESIVAGICPSVGPCCYEVGEEVRTEALSRIGPEASDHFVTRGGKLHFDLWSANTHQLIRSGLLPDHIHVAGLCTLCHHDLFPSYRKQGAAATRFAAVIGWF
jgi:YfiH family protein